MRIIQKLILPILIILVAVIIYIVYFGGEKTTGNFADFDTNNNANKEIRLTVVREKGVEQNTSAGTAMFFGKDSKGIEYPVQVPLPLPDDFDKLQTVLLKGHLHKDHFHAIEISE
jgi:cytochrome c-type biogenesis protein CcmE